MGPTEEGLTGSEAGLSVRRVDPLALPDWDQRVARFSGATVFHSRGWCHVLHDTYGHRPHYLVLEQAGQWQACLPLMEVSSRVTGRRAVSLPFTDFCACLAQSEAAARALWPALPPLAREHGWKRLELRNREVVPPETPPSVEFFGHTLDLRASREDLQLRMEGSARRSLRKALHSGLKTELATDLDAMAAYYQLHCLTRKRHGLPPQPWRFFQNLQRHLLGPGRGFVVLVRKDQTVIAGAVFLHFSSQAVYKFGASDLSAQELRPNNLAMWTGMSYYCEHGFQQLHLGRTSLWNEGLRRFKLSLGAQEERIPVFCWSRRHERFVPGHDRAEGWHTVIFRHLPPKLLRWAGQVLYPHMD